MRTDLQSRRVVEALVSTGLLEHSREGDALRVVDAVLVTPGAEQQRTPVRRRLAEIAGYVGAAFVVGAAILFVSTSWADLTIGQQASLLLVTGAILAAAGTGFVVTAGGREALAAPAHAVRRRLSSVLYTGAGASSAFGVGVLLGDRMANTELAVMLAALSGLAVVLAGYVAAPTTVGQLGAAVAAATMVPSGLGALPSDSDSVIPLGLGFLTLGVVWLLAAERSWWQELTAARVVGSVLALVGAQVPVFDDPAWVGYLLTGAVAAAAFAGYVVSRGWPYLATGVVALTIVVPEALNDWVGGSLGAAGVLLATGVTLLVAALLGLRLRQELQEA